MKAFIVRYRINRSWGDNIVEALWWALRNKSFPEINNYTIDEEK